MTREELYALAWSEPMTHLAVKLGLSDRGLAGICSRHDIPVPERGYWAKIAAGRSPAPAPLPAGESCDIVFRNQSAEPKKSDPLKRPDQPASEHTTLMVDFMAAEVERAVSVAADFHRWCSVQKLLGEMSVRAAGEKPESGLAILAWVESVKRRLERDDPVTRLVKSLR